MKICGSQLVGKVLGFFLMWHFCSNGHVVNGQMVRLDSAEVSNDLQRLTLTICFTDAQSGSGNIYFSASPDIFDSSSQQSIRQLMIDNNQQCGDYTITEDIQSDQIGMEATVSLINTPFTLQVSPRPGDSSRTVTIPGVFFNSTTYSVQEGSGSVWLSICRFPTDDGLPTTLMSIGGTAESGSDYNGLPQSVQINSGVRCAPTLIAIVDDDIAEGTETFNVSISASSSLMVSPSRGTSTVIIMDDDVETVSVILESPSYSPSQVTSGVNNMLSLNLPVRAVSGDIIGTNLWMVDVFLSSDMMGQGSNLEFGAAALQDDALNVALSSGMTATLSNLEINLDLTSVLCAQIPYICVRLSRNQNSSPLFILTNSTGGDDVIHCRTIVCHETVAVTLGIPSYSPSLITSEENNILAFDLPVTSLRAGISGMNLWMVEVFLSSSSSGQDNKLASASASLPSTAMDQGIAPQGMSTLSNLEVNLDVTNFSCDRFSHICVSLSRNPSSHPVFVLVNSEGGNSILQCQTIGCQASPCISNPCQNGGTCFVVRNDVHCACEDGFFGDTCGNVLALTCPSDLRIITDVGNSMSDFDLGIEIDCSSDLSCKIDNKEIRDLNLVHAVTGQRNVSCECGGSLGGHQTSLTCSFTVTVIACDEIDGVDGMYGPNCSLPCTCASNAECNIESGECSGDSCGNDKQPTCDKDNFNVNIANDSVTVNEKETFSLVCMVNLGPVDVTVTWEDPEGNTIQRDVNTETMISTLTITNATSKDHGKYKCTGTLKAPTDSVTSDTDSVVVNVEVQGKINPGFERMRKAVVGENVNLTCVAFGNPQPNVTWLNIDGRDFSNNIEQSHERIEQSPFCCDVTRDLQFTGLTIENNGTYTCSVIVNGTVTDSKDVDLIVIDFPEIANLEITRRASTSLMLSWQVTDDGQDEVDCEATHTEVNGDNVMVSTPCEEDKSCEIKNLTANTEYDISVVCRNYAGRSNTLSVRGATIRSTPEEVPALIETNEPDSVNSTSIVVILPRDISEENGQISCYEFVVVVEGGGSGDPDEEYPFNKVLNASGENGSPYRAVVMDRSTFRQTQRVVIGMASPPVTTCELTDPPAKRKRRALTPPQTLTAKNDPLKSEQAYNIFLRVYVPSGESYDYESSDYLEFETTAAVETSNLGVIIAVSLVLIVIVTAVSVAICIVWKRLVIKDHTSGNNKKETQMSRVNDPSKSTVYMNEQQTTKEDGSSYEAVQSEVAYEIQLKHIAKTHSASKYEDTYEFEHTDVSKEGTALPALPVSPNLDAVIYEDMPDDVNYSHALYSLKKAPVPFRVSELPQYIQQKRLNEKYGLEKEFMVLPKGQLEPWTEALKRHNVGRSRKPDVLPYDSSRVKLVFDSKQQSDFYNASFVMDQHNRQSFIAAQSPSKDTVHEFLWMIWQERVSIIVMISDLNESGQDACFPYWPMGEGKTKHYGKLSVIMKRSRKYPDHAVRDLLIQNKEEDYIAVTQFQYHSWPYQGVAQHPTSMFYFIRDVKMCLKKKHFPLLVHCSDGAGATGTFIASFCLLDEISQSNEISVYNFVKKMRKNRINLVSTKAQYVLIYDVLLMEFNSPVTVYSTSDFKRLIVSKKKLSSEFQSLLRPKYQLDAQSGSSKKNKNRNRFQNIIPLDISRPHLQSGSALGGGDYINACFANSYFKKNAFILTQSPLPVTVEDFWRMVYDQKSSKIIMLNQLDAADKTCNFYWPTAGSQQSGSVIVKCFSTVTNELFVCREIGVKHQDEEGLLKLKHFQLLKWPQGKSDVFDLMDFIEAAGFSEGTEPFIVHCLDGVSRSGIFVTIHNELQRLKDTEKVDIYQTLQILRERNPFVCSSLKEYLLCYEVLQAFVESGHYF